jgi:penicillin-binding protein 1C
MYLLKEASQNIPKNTNACAIIHNHQKNEIVAYVGSTDFFNKERLGQNDFCQAIRSPGSTLKPLIFGLAFDEGLIEPETLFRDERKHFGAYAPHNFDRTYHGIMSASETLQLSLNIPSVELLNLLGPIRFYAALKAIGVNPEFQNKDVKPNLSMALGGVGLKLIDLVKIFSTFATEGQAFDINYVQNKEPVPPKFLLYPSSAIKVKEILEKNPFTFLNNQKIALKTGTSYGYRDALALAFNDQYTIGVWVGVPKEGNLNEKTGFELAVPILRQVFDIVPKSDNDASNRAINEIPNSFKLKPFLKQHVLVSKKEVIASRFKVDFPQKDSLLMITKGDIVPIRFKGGQKPYRLYVNNVLDQLNVFQKKLTFWPKEEGFYTLTLQDKNGDYDSVTIEIRWNQ